MASSVASHRIALFAHGLSKHNLCQQNGYRDQNQISSFFLLHLRRLRFCSYLYFIIDYNKSHIHKKVFAHVVNYINVTRLAHLLSYGVYRVKRVIKDNHPDGGSLFINLIRVYVRIRHHRQCNNNV